MIKNIVSATLVVFVLVIGGIYLASISSNKSENTTTIPLQNNQSGISQNTNPTSISYFRAKVAKHKSQSDCWLIINNKVYDISVYLRSHPGGVGTVIPYCGGEATQAFNTKDQGQPHSSKAENLLNKYYVGNLK